PGHALVRRGGDKQRLTRLSQSRPYCRLRSLRAHARLIVWHSLRRRRCSSLSEDCTRPSPQTVLDRARLSAAEAPDSSQSPNNYDASLKHYRIIFLFRPIPNSEMRLAGCPQLRASNEGLPRPRVARAWRAPTRLILSLPFSSPIPRCSPTTSQSSSDQPLPAQD